MSSGRGVSAALSLRIKLLTLVAAPAIVGLLVGWGLPQRILGTAAPAEAHKRGAEIADAFAGALRDGRVIAEAALDSSPEWVMRRPGSSPIASRLEGVGLLTLDFEYLEWAGRPAEPGLLNAMREPARWVVRLDGVLTRLLVVAGPDDEQRYSLASFVIDGLLPQTSITDLLPEELFEGVAVEVTFIDTLAAPVSLSEPPIFGDLHGAAIEALHPDTVLLLRAPDGTRVADGKVHVIDPALRRSLRVDAGKAWAALLLSLLMVVLFDWRGFVTTWSGCLLALLAIFICRAALLAAHAPAVLLSPELGSANLFGSSEAMGLIGSPADLLLTATALYLAALALRRRCRAFATEGPRVALAVALGGATLLTAVSLWISVAVVRDSTIQVLEEAEITGWNARSVITLGVALAILAAAEMWALDWILVRRPRRRRRPMAASVVVAVAVVAVGAISSIAAQRLSVRLGHERLGSEFAPLVLEQSARRSLALSAAVRHVEQSYRDQSSGGVPASSQPAYLAYRFWVTGDLFLTGYKSSLDFYTPGGNLISHFAFDLPESAEMIFPAMAASGELVVREEEMRDPADLVRQDLLHAEMTIERSGEPLGVVIGHILDEPDNLPFLPWSQPYLAALGPAAPYGVVDPFSQDLQYVLYDDRGSVRLTTLSQPPAYTAGLRSSAAGPEQEPVEVLAGDKRYSGMALDDAGRLHLLLLPARDLFEYIASATRLVLVPLLLLALLTFLRMLFPPFGPAFLLHRLRESFRRKLLAALLAASILPLVGLALFLQGYVERRGESALIEFATQFVGAAERQLATYAAFSADEPGEAPVEINDWLVHWLRDMVGQEIIVYENGRMLATSKRELFDSGLLPPRLDGTVRQRLLREGLPSLVVPTTIGSREIPVAYAPVRAADPSRYLVVAVPMVLEQRQIAHAINRVVEMILLATVGLMALLAVATSYLARTVADPVKELVGATARIADGDYAARLKPRTRDEIAELVQGFNSMAGALAAQRADLERRREYTERLLRHATTGVISTDPQGKIVTLNPAATKLLAAAGRSLRVGAELTRALADADALEPLALRLSRRPLPAGEPEDIDLELDGKPLRYRLVRVDLPEPSGGTVGRLILLDDVTELMHSHRLAAWAEMARAIAHEIKNPLTPIQLSTEHLRRLLRDRGVIPDEPVEACLETVFNQVRSLYDIAGEFSAYAKLPALAPEPADPVAFMRTTIGPYRASTPPLLTLNERYETCPSVAIDAKVLARAVINLVENALHAMPNGGTLTLAARPDDAGDEVLIEVADTGSGLADEVRKHLFDPYFSTKSSGTGLGLAIALRAVEAHHGTIEVESEPDRGTLFRIRLPAVPPA